MCGSIPRTESAVEVRGIYKSGWQMLPADEVAADNVTEGLVSLVNVVRAIDVILVCDMIHALVEEHRVHIIHSCWHVLPRWWHQMKTRVIQQRIMVRVVARVRHTGVIIAKRAAWSRSQSEREEQRGMQKHGHCADLTTTKKKQQQKCPRGNPQINYTGACAAKSCDTVDKHK